MGEWAHGVSQWDQTWPLYGRNVVKTPPFCCQSPGQVMPVLGRLAANRTEVSGNMQMMAIATRRMRVLSRILSVTIFAALMGAASLVHSQPAPTPGVAAPQPVETRPLAPPPSATVVEPVPEAKPIEIAPAQQPAAPPATTPAPVQAQPAPPAGVAPLPGPDSTLAGKPGDPADIDDRSEERRVGKEC